MARSFPHTRMPMVGYLTSGGLSNLGNALAGVVYPWLVYDLTGSAAAMGLVAFVVLAPTVVGAVVGSMVVDRLGVRTVALAADALSAVTGAAVAALHLAGLLSVEILVGLALIGALLDGPGSVAHDARWPEIARMARVPLIRANVVDDVIDNGAQLAGPVLAGLALAYGGSEAGLIAATLISGVAFLTTLVTLPRFRRRHGGGPLSLATCLAGPRFILSTPQLRRPLVLTAVGMAVFVAIESVILPAVLRVEGRAGLDLGLFLGSSAVGALAVNLGLLVRRQAPSPRWVFTIAFLGFALSLLFLAIDRSTIMLSVAGTLLGIAAGPLTPIVQTLLQTVPPKLVRAQVLGSAVGLMLLGALPGVLIAGVAVDHAPGNVVFATAAMIAVFAAALSFRSLRPAPVVPDTKVAPACPAGDVIPGSTRPLSLPPDFGRVSLARLTLIHEWKRYLAAVLAVAFSGLLLLVQLGLLLGMFGTVTTVLDRAQADLWVVGASTKSFDLAREMPGRVEMRLRTHPDVTAVQTMGSGTGDWRRSDGAAVFVYLTGLDVTRQSLSLPSSFTRADRLALQQLGGVIVDATDLEKLGVRVGDTVEVSRKRVTVVGTTTGMRAIGGANVFASQATLRWLLGESAPPASAYYLVKLRLGADLAKVQAELQGVSSGLDHRVMQPHELSAMSQLYWLLESGSGAGFGFATILGLLVGVAITSQTLRAAVLSAIREYATLRALGVSLGALRAVVIEQSAWIGAAGLAVTGMLTTLVWLVAAAGDVAVSFPWWSILTAALFTLFVALLSGYLALKPLYATEPAELLR